MFVWEQSKTTILKRKQIKGRKSGPKPKKEKEEIVPVQIEPKLKPRDQIANILKKDNSFIAMANIFNNLPIEMQEQVKK